MSLRVGGRVWASAPTSAHILVAPPLSLGCCPRVRPNRRLSRAPLGVPAKHLTAAAWSMPMPCYDAHEPCRLCPCLPFRPVLFPLHLYFLPPRLRSRPVYVSASRLIGSCLSSPGSCCLLHAAYPILTIPPMLLRAHPFVFIRLLRPHCSLSVSSPPRLLAHHLSYLSLLPRPPYPPLYLLTHARRAFDD